MTMKTNTVIISTIMLLALFSGVPNCANSTELFGTTLVADIAQEVSPSVVAIESVNYVRARRRRGFSDPFFDRIFGHLFEDDFFGFNNVIPRRGNGSGVLISPDGHLLTNEHVIADADEIVVILNNGEKVKAEVIGMDSRSDLAVLKVDVKMPLPHIPIGDSDNLRVGEWVIAIGNPFSLGMTVTTGVVSALNRDLTIDNRRNYRDLIQTDASINPGNSGGPLVNSKGELVGINTAIIPSGQGIGFAIPGNRARRIVGDLIAYGRVKKPFLGVKVQKITTQLAQHFDIPDKGVLVTDVTPGSAASSAGLAPGDVILQIGAHKINSENDFNLSLEDHRVGETVEIRIFRRGKEGVTNIELKESPAVKELLGIEVKTVDSSAASEYRLFVRRGCVITSVVRGSPAYNAGLRTGDVIQQINRRVVNSKDEFKGILENLTVPERILLRVVRGQTVNLLVINVE